MSAAPGRDAGAPALDPDNPWPGLASYDEAAREYFSGRTAEAAELARRIVDEPVTVLFGKSGLGKSSLLRAGVFPLLRERGLLPVFVRLRFDAGAPPLMDQLAGALFDAFATGSIKHPPRRDGEALWDYLHREGMAFWAPKIQPVRPVFVLDQFEEVFTLGAAGRQRVEAFREQFADLAENRIPAALARRLESSDAAQAGLDLHARPYKIVLSLREDFLPELEAWQTAMPSLRRNRMRLLPMSCERALEAVWNHRTRHLVDEALARQIVAYLAGGGAAGAGQSLPATADDGDGCVEPALLSLVCRGINDARQRAGKPRFDAALFDAGKGTIVADFYEQSLADQPARVRRFIEDELVTEQGFRNSFAVAAAVAQGAVTDGEIAALVDRRLLRLEHHLGAERVELTHDLLTRAVLDARAVRLAAERAAALRQRVLKYGGIAALVLLTVVFVAWQQYARLVDERQAAIDHGESDRRRIEAEKGRADAEKAKAEAALAAQTELARLYTDQTTLKLQAEQATAAAIAAARLAGEERDRAEAAGKVARSRELAARANSVLAADREGAVRLALDAMRAAETPEAYAALLGAAMYLWPTARLDAASLGGEPAHVAIDGDGGRVGVVAGDGQVSVWDVRRREPRLLLPRLPLQGATVAEFEPGGKRLLIARGGRLDRLDLATGGIDPLPMPQQAGESAARQVAVSGDGRWLAILSVAGGIFIRDLRDADGGWAMPQTDSAIEFSLAPDGRRIAWVARTSLEVAVAERGDDGAWSTRALTVRGCARPQSVATASDYVVATWLAQSCTQPLMPGSGPTAPNTDPQLAMKDNVSSANGQAFVSILRSGDLRVGRGTPAAAQGVSLLKSADEFNASSLKGQLAVDDGGTRLAMIRSDKDASGKPVSGKASVHIVAVGANKLLLAQLPNDRSWLLADGRRIAQAVPMPGGGAELQVVAIDQVMQGDKLPQPELRCAMAAMPREPQFGSRRVAVKTVDDHGGGSQTMVYGLAPGCPRAGPFAGDGSLLGRGDELLLVERSGGKTVRGTEALVQRVADGQQLVAWDITGGTHAGRFVGVSPGRTALIFSRPSGAGRTTLVVDAFAVQGERLVPAGRVVDLPETALRTLTISDDARTLTERRGVKLAAPSAAGGTREAVRELRWPLDPARETRADDAAAARQAVAPPRPAGNSEALVRSSSGRFAVRRSAAADNAGSERFSLIGGDGKTVVHAFPPAVSGPFRFSDDDRWLSYLESGEPRVFDLEARKPLQPWPNLDGSVELVAGRKLLKVSADNSLMLIPLDPQALQRFATWLLPPEPYRSSGAGRVAAAQPAAAKPRAAR